MRSLQPLANGCPARSFVLSASSVIPGMKITLSGGAAHNLRPRSWGSASQRSMAWPSSVTKISASVITAETVMSKAKLNAMQVRLEVLTLAVAALAGEVPAERVAAVQDGLRHGIEQWLDGVDALSPQADAAMAADLCSLLSALGGLSGLTPWRSVRAKLPG